MAMHYGFGVLPARPHKPRDKAKAESGVQLVQRWIVASLRHRKFFRLADLNDAIRQLLERINHRPFSKREGTRASLFEALDKPALRPLPAAPPEAPKNQPDKSPPAPPGTIEDPSDILLKRCRARLM
jgi:hypothetical protein